MSQSWKTQSERGSPALIRLIAWIARRLGRRPARLLLWPIAVYFLLFAPVPRRASRDYLRRVLGREPTLSDVFTHIRTFAATILDRVFFLTDDFERFDIRLHGIEELEAGLNSGRGCILLGGHVGSFEIMRALAVLRGQVPLKILMYQENSQRIGAVVRALNPDLADRIISLGTPQAMLEVKEWLDGGGALGMLGDRITHGAKLVPVHFLGAEAAMPTGAFHLAAVSGAPVVAFSGLYKGGNRYDIHFRLLADRVRLAGRRRRDGDPPGQDVQVLVQSFASTLEGFVREAPYNWFNFFDFWAHPAAPPDAGEPGPRG